MTHFYIFLFINVKVGKTYVIQTHMSCQEIEKEKEKPKKIPVSALMASCKPGGLTTTVSAFAVITAFLSATLT